MYIQPINFLISLKLYKKISRDDFRRTPDEKLKN